jgi:hypothetical protein
LNRETALERPARVYLKAGQFECNLERNMLVLVMVKLK